MGEGGKLSVFREWVQKNAPVNTPEHCSFSAETYLL